mgnify:CR=1 FL=1
MEVNTHFISQNVAAPNTHQIGVYRGNKKVGCVPLNKFLYPNIGKKLYSFGALSDIHLGSADANTDFQKALTYFNEVEAYTFEKFVVTEFNDNLSDEELINGLFKQSNYFDDSLPNSTNSNEYENAAKNIIVNGIFNKSNFEITVKLFKNNSNANNSGLYSQPHYKERTGNEKRYLLESIFSK